MKIYPKTYDKPLGLLLFPPSGEKVWFLWKFSCFMKNHKILIFSFVQKYSSRLWFFWFCVRILHFWLGFGSCAACLCSASRPPCSRGWVCTNACMHISSEGEISNFNSTYLHFWKSIFVDLPQVRMWIQNELWSPLVGLAICDDMGALWWKETLWEILSLRGFLVILIPTYLRTWEHDLELIWGSIRGILGWILWKREWWCL